MTVLRIVDVIDGYEVSRAEVVGDAVRYSGGETAHAIVKQLMRDADLSEVEAVQRLSETGWSNGYLMADLST